MLFNIYLKFCFAYKSDRAITSIKFNLLDTVYKNTSSISMTYSGSSDNQWHYDCVDLFATFNPSSSVQGTKPVSQYPTTKRVSQVYNCLLYLNHIEIIFLKFYNIQVMFNVPNYNNFYIDAVTFRNSVPINMGNKFQKSFNFFS